MRHLIRPSTIVAVAIVASSAWNTLSAQSTGNRRPTDQIEACSLLSVADVRRITGMANIPDRTSGHAPGEGVGGGSSCIYGGKRGLVPQPDATPAIQVALISPQEAKKYFDEYGRTGAPKGAKVEPVSGVGDAAYGYVGLQGLTLWVRKGQHTLVTAMEIKPPATAESVRPTVVAVAKAAVAKLP
jgi:hypothetical protein